MTPILLWVVLACGVDAGYEPADDGHLEYIIQIEPQLVGSLGAGHDVTSEVPRGLDVRHYRLTVGTAVLPRIPAAKAGGGPSTAGGTAARAADAFEAPDRADEEIGSATPQVQVGYELLSATSGKYICVIEIDPRSLGDLSQHDLTGDIPPGLSVTRFVISTNPGTAPGEQPSNVVGQATLPNATQAVPAMADGGPGTGDDDPSPWEPKTSVTTPVSPPTSAGPPPLAAGSAIPDDAPGGTVAPPAAMPPHEELSKLPSSGPTSPPQDHLDPPSGFSQKGFAAERTPDEPARTADPSRAAGAAPGRLAVESTAEPLTMTSGVGDAESQAGVRVARKADAGTVESGEKRGAPVSAEGTSEKETREPSPTKPWLPLAFTVFLLLASLGGNVFLGWVAWDSYNRNRTVGNKIEGRKPSLSS